MTIELQARPSGTTTMTTPRMVAGLPAGFRFHPTDEELIVHYLRRRAASAPCPAAIIAEVDIYKLDPWDLPSRAVFGQPDGNEWYFFSPRDRKYPNGVRPNRAAGSGYWKATGTDKPITAGSVPGGEVVGVKKALVFYQGRPPKGLKTNWIMHEYRLASAVNTYQPPSKFKASSSMRLDDWVLCRIYKKPNQQLSPFYDRSPSPPSMDAGQSSSRMLPRAPSISDYLVDYPDVSELFGTMPAPPEPELSSGTSGLFLSSINRDEAGTARKRQTSTESINDDGGDMSSLRASKRWLSSDASMTTMNNTYSMFGPDQPSSQDRI
ncbi:hypothetical protein QYE76_049150 [Lolium multiflorum]|uniref:NAC domain-containing protein n=1 Tax=Lolium multiflorum TaxID=4521 RepID=A0AAD8SMI9_LOLMU|nr:hypothetical protein QYE76_049150 [Lolium multiflorum]